MSEITLREDVALLAYSPLAFGHLSGKYLADPAARGRPTEFENFGVRYAKPGVRAAVERYAEIARRRGMSLTALALAFVYSRWFVGSTIVGDHGGATRREPRRWHRRLDEDALAEIERVHQLHGNPAP